MIRMISGKNGAGMKLHGLKAYPKSVTAPGAENVTHQVANSVTSNPGSRPNSIPVR